MIEGLVSLARVLYDSWQSAPSLAGFRGASEHRLLCFEFEGGGVDLQIAPDPARAGRFWVNGEVRGVAPCAVRSQSGGAAEQETQTDADGYFEFETVPGSLMLTLVAARGMIQVGPIQIGTR